MRGDEEVGGPGDAPSERQPGDEDEASSPQDDPPAAPPQRGQKRRLRKAKAEELADWDYFQGLDPSEPIEVVVSGHTITSEGGSAEAIGAAVHRLGRLFRTLGGSEAFVESFAFGNSLHIQLRASDLEVKRLRDAKDARGTAKGEADEEAVPDVYLAAAFAADLIEMSSSEVPARAISFGSEAAQAFKSLTTLVIRDSLEIEIPRPEHNSVARLTTHKAELIAQALREVTEPRKFIETLVGTLSIADAEHKEFGLHLDPKGPKPEAFRGKRLIRGTYTPRVEDAIRDRGLWGHRVLAQIQVEQDALVSTSTIRPPVYTLLKVDEAVT